jgi:hypothetical protein
VVGALERVMAKNDDLRAQFSAAEPEIEPVAKLAAVPDLS